MRKLNPAIYLCMTGGLHYWLQRLARLFALVGLRLLVANIVITPWAVNFFHIIMKQIVSKREIEKSAAVRVGVSSFVR